MNPIYVTRPYLPPLKEFIPYLEEIWESHVLANGGKFHQQLEKELAEYLGVKYACLFANGTLALLTALQALRITGEVITTPFSFVATSHSLLWNGIKPVFVDIKPGTFNIDADKIEAAITPQTTAILPVHVYGYPCDVEKIEKIADIYGLKVIYDAAHAFGVSIERKPGDTDNFKTGDSYRINNSILNYGDLSVLSFHATKVFNTFEGGAIVCHDQKTKERIDRLKNFGYNGEVAVIASGINGKMNEIQAAFGLLQLKHIENAIRARQILYGFYKEYLFDVKGIIFPNAPSGLIYNYSYLPILITEEYPLTRDQLNDELRKAEIYPRRYFHPLISEFPMYKGLSSASADNLPVATKTANQVLCLPLYPDLTIDDVRMICDEIKKLSKC
jgi:dTDP-4-amino-4,6-dideoxygalactose transaminase